MNNKSLTEQAQEIIKIAEKHGVEQNFFSSRHSKGIRCKSIY